MSEHGVEIRSYSNAWQLAKKWAYVIKKTKQQSRDCLTASWQVAQQRKNLCCIVASPW